MTIDEEVENIIRNAAEEVALEVRERIIDHGVTGSTIKPMVKDMLHKKVDYLAIRGYAAWHLGRLVK